jgi:hypothetical protein
MYTLLIIDDESDWLMRLHLRREVILTMTRFMFESLNGVDSSDSQYKAPTRYAGNLFAFVVDAHSYVNQPKCIGCYTALSPAEGRDGGAVPPDGVGGLCPICQALRPSLDKRIMDFMTSHRLAYLDVEGRLNLDLMAQDAAAEFGLSEHPQSFRSLAETLEKTHPDSPDTDDSAIAGRAAYGPASVG